MLFEPAAYMRDTRPLTLAARGLWADLLCVMDQAEPRGVLQSPDGGKPTREQIAEIAFISPDYAGALMNELYKAGVFSLDHRGRVYCRRMVRERTEKKEPLKNVAKRYQAEPPSELLEWVAWWNGLVDDGLVRGKVNAKRPALEICRAWIRVESDADVRDLLQPCRRMEIESEIKQGGEWLAGWFSFADLIAGKNGNGESKLRRLLNGFYRQASRGKAKADPNQTVNRLEAWGMR